MQPMIDSAAPLPEVFRRMREEQTHHLVVERGGNMVGIVSDRDLLFKGIPLYGEVLNPLLTVEDVMTPLPNALSDESSIDEALAMMAKFRTEALPLVRRDALVQIVTQADLLRLMTKLYHGNDSTIQGAKEKGQVAMANPVVQNVMNLVAEMGI